MVWTASACVVRKDFWKKGEHALERVADGHPALAKFAEAARSLDARFEYGVSMLDVGMLCQGDIAQALSDAVKKPVQRSGHWLPEAVKHVAKDADWRLLSTAYLPGHRECARAFLTICAENDLAIEFS